MLGDGLNPEGECGTHRAGIQSGQDNPGINDNRHRFNRKPITRAEDSIHYGG